MDGRVESRRRVGATFWECPAIGIPKSRQLVVRTRCMNPQIRDQLGLATGGLNQVQLGCYAANLEVAKRRPRDRKAKRRMI
jgi:hypothetical protein